MRASFGGTSGDLGSFFASLFSQQEAQQKQDAKQAEYDAKQAEADAKQLAAEKKAQQAADDADAFDQWQHGTSSDEEWLAYIATRVGNETDPKEHEKWVKYQREYTQQISDNRADYQYKSGQMSIAQYIAYQKGQLATFDPNSQAYRDRALVVSGLLDTQAQNDLNTQVNDVTSKIATGKATYKDLLAVYQNGLKTTTNADLKAQITTQIGKIKDQITQDEAQGALDKTDYLFKSNKISGKEAGRQIRAVAEKYFKGDEHKFYTLLESAISFEKYPGLERDGSGVKKATGGGGRRSGGGGGSSANADKKALALAQKNAINLDRAYANRGKDITTQYLETQGRGPIIDPLSGKPLPVGPDGKVSTALIHEIQLQTMAHYDHLAALYTARGEPKQATQAQRDKGYFIAGSGKPGADPGLVQTINTIGPAEQAQRLQSSMISALNSASQSNDPAEMLRVAADYRDKMLAWAGRLTSSTQNVRAVGPDNATQQITSPKGLASLPDKELIGEIVSTAMALDAAVQPGANVDQIVANLGGGKYLDHGLTVKSLKALAAQNEAVTALQTGNAAIVLTADGPHIVPMESVSKPGLDPVTGKPTLLGSAPEVNLAELRDSNHHQIDTKGASLVDGYVQVNGVPMAAKVLAFPYRDDQYKAWVAAKAITIDGYKIAKGQAIPAGLLFAGQGSGDIGRKEASWQARQDLIQSGEIVQQPVDMGWHVAYVGSFTDTNGDKIAPHAWYNDPKLGLWSTQPDWLQYVDRNPDGSVRVLEDGRPDHVTYKPSVTAGMSRWPYAGSDARPLQAISDATPINGEMTVDALGNLHPAVPEDFAKSYYDPSYAAMQLAIRSFRDTGLWSDPEIQQAKVDEAKDNSLAAFRAAQQHDKPSFLASDAGAAGMTQALTDFGTSVGINVGPGGSRKVTPDVNAAPRPGGASTSPLPPITAPTLNTASFTAPSAPVRSQDMITAPKVMAPPVSKPSLKAPKAAAPPPIVQAPANLGGGAGALGHVPPPKPAGVQAVGTLPPQKVSKPKPIDRVRATPT